MIFDTAEGNLCKTGFILLSLILLTAGTVFSADLPEKPIKPSSTQSDMKIEPGEWKKVVDAAKKEGKLVLCADPSEEWRKSVVDLFRNEYPEIKVEYTGSNGHNFWPRVRQERKLGQKLWDLRVGGMEVQAYEAKNDGFLNPIRPLLLPEIADDSKWIGGVDGLFHDRENKFMPAYTLFIQRTTAINRDFIKESELKSSGQLTDPKFKGKIVMQSPSGGASLSALGNLAYMYGENFVRDLLSKQNAAVTDDKRQQAEWVVRGKYPIALGFNETQLVPYEKQGLGKNVTRAEDKITPVGTGTGGVFLLKDAPHPNAVKVYINWLLSQKTQMKLSKNVNLNSRRTDVSPVDKATAVDPANLSNYRFYSTEENVEITERLRPLIKETLKY